MPVNITVKGSVHKQAINMADIPVNITVNLLIFIISGVFDGIIFQDYLHLENIQPDQVSHLTRNSTQRRRKESCFCSSKHT
jgi:hypothetical protein